MDIKSHSVFLCSKKPIQKLNDEQHKRQPTNTHNPLGKEYQTKTYQYPCQGPFRAGEVRFGRIVRAGIDHDFQQNLNGKGGRGLGVGLIQGKKKRGNHF